MYIYILNVVPTTLLTSTVAKFVGPAGADEGDTYHGAIIFIAVLYVV